MLWKALQLNSFQQINMQKKQQCIFYDKVHSDNYEGRCQGGSARRREAAIFGKERETDAAEAVRRLQRPAMPIQYKTEHFLLFLVVSWRDPYDICYNRVTFILPVMQYNLFFTVCQNEKNMI